MLGLIPLHHGFRMNMGNRSINIDGKKSFGTEEVVLSHQFLRVNQIVNQRTDGIGDFRQDADNFTLFGVLQLLEFIIGIENVRRFDENGLSRGGLVMYETAQTAFELGGDGNAEATVTDGHLSIFFHNAVLFGGGEYFADLAVGIAGNAVDGSLDVGQFFGGVVAHLPFVVENAVDGARQVALQLHLGAHRPKSRVAVVFVAHFEIDENAGHGLHETAQADQFVKFDMGAVDAQPFQSFAEVVEILCGKGFVKKQQLAEFLYCLKGGHDLQHVSHEPHVIDRLRPLRTQTVVQNQPPHDVKTDFLLKIVRVEHIVSLVLKMAAKVHFFRQQRIGNRQKAIGNRQ